MSYKESIAFKGLGLNLERKCAVDYSVVVPVYNSKATLRQLVREIEDFFHERGYSYEIILVDDGSSDGSAEEISALTVMKDHIHGISMLSNVGQQRALFSGLLRAKGDWVLTMDDDLQHDIREVPKMMAQAIIGCDLVFGVYGDYGSKGLRALGSKLVGFFFRWRYRNFADLRVSSFRLISRKVYRHLVDRGDAFVYVSAELLLHAQHVANVPVSRRERVYGKSGYNLKKCIILCAQLWFHYGVKSLVFGERNRHDEENTDGWSGQLPEKRHPADEVPGIRSGGCGL